MGIHRVFTRSYKKTTRRFVDVARVKVLAGDGGHGGKSFYTDLRIRIGPADGGDGGAGGSVYFEASAGGDSDLSMSGLRTFKAKRGGPGGKQESTGAKGADRTVKVPPGTIIYELDEEGPRIAADLNDGDRFLAVRGGKGGKGNRHFQTSRNRTPIAQSGIPGQKKVLILELKSIAHVGLVGYPNAGKSTLLRKMSSAKPEVAAYPFTTLHPVIGVVELETAAEKTEGLLHRFTVADLPGILEDAHQGRGLGFDFLRHIERTDVLAYVVDMSVPNPTVHLETLLNELDQYMYGLRTSRPSILVANKLDTTSNGRQVLSNMLKWLDRNNLEIDVFPCSALHGQGTDAIIRALDTLVRNSSNRKDRILKTPEFVKRGLLPVAEKDPEWQADADADGDEDEEEEEDEEEGEEDDEEEGEYIEKKGPLRRPPRRLRNKNKRGRRL